MGWWQISTDTLASSRFVVSPLAETVASLSTLERATAAHPRERAWLERWLPAYRRLLADDPLAARIVRAALPHAGAPISSPRRPSRHPPGRSRTRSRRSWRGSGRPSPRRPAPISP